MALNLVDLLCPRFAPVQRCILTYIDVGSAIALSQTCKQLDLRSLLKSTIYDIDRYLKPWLRDPQQFRMLQRDLGILIIDRFAHNFLAGEVKDKQELFLAMDTAQRSQLEAYLESEGFNISTDEDREFREATAPGKPHIGMVATPYTTAWLVVSV